MAANSKTKKADRMAWFKFDVGAFLSGTMGLSSLHTGLYVKLMSIYWSSSNKLTDAPEILKRKLGVTSLEDEAALDLVLTEFFPKDDSGNYRHDALDAQLADVVEYSTIQAARGAAGARARAENAKQPAHSLATVDADEF